jgi:hypothetical protein
MSLLVEKSLLDFIVITLILGGWASWMTGKAFAQTWGRLLGLLCALIALGFVVRFVHFSVFEAKLFSLHYLLIDIGFCLIFGLIGFRLTRVNQMVQQYWWLYERTSVLGYKSKSL